MSQPENSSVRDAATAFDVSAAVAGLRVAEEQLRIAQRYVEQPITGTSVCPLCGLHPHDFTVEEYERELRKVEARLHEAERVLRITSGWNPAEVDTATAIQPALDYFKPKEAEANG